MFSCKASLKFNVGNVTKTRWWNHDCREFLPPMQDSYNGNDPSKKTKCLLDAFCWKSDSSWTPNGAFVSSGTIRKLHLLQGSAAPGAPGLRIETPSQDTQERMCTFLSACGVIVLLKCFIPSCVALDSFVTGHQAFNTFKKETLFISSLKFSLTELFFFLVLQTP